MTAIIKPIQLQDLTENEWNAYYKFYLQYEEENNPNDERMSLEHLKLLFEEQFVKGEMDSVFFIIQDALSHDLIGVARLAWFKESSTNYKTNKHLVQGVIQLLKSHEDFSIVDSVLKEFYKLMQLKKKSTLVLSGENEFQIAFLNRVNAQTALMEIENRLYLDTVDWEMVRA